MSQQSRETAPDYGHQAAIGFMNYLADHDWNFWLSDSGVLSMQIGRDPAGLSQNDVLAIMACLRTECEKALANIHAESDAVQ